MDYVRLGQTGLVVSRVGLGAMTFGWQVDAAEAAKMTAAALDRGITFFDTANVYGGEHGDSEIILGAALSKRRDAITISTKFGRAVRPGPHGSGASRTHIRWSVERSLRRLNTDYIDILSVHEFDPVTPIEETLRSLDDLVRAGKVRYVGLSNFAAFQAAIACGIAERLALVRPACLQFRYNLLLRDAERETLPACRALAIGGIAYNALAGGLLTGLRPEDHRPTARLATNENYRTLYLNETNLAAHTRLTQVCGQAGRSVEATAVQWLLGSVGVDACLLGATSYAQFVALMDNLATPLDDQVRQTIDACSARSTTTNTQTHA